MGGYRVKEDKGWYYASLIKLAENYGLSGEQYRALSIEEICADVLADKFVVASVHQGRIRFDKVDPREPRNGHLVVVRGFRFDGKNVLGFFINNPSGRIKETQENAFIPIENFASAFGGRGFSLWQ